MFRKLLMFLVVLVIGISSASVAYADHSWGGYHWARTSNPFALKLGNNVSTSWKSFLDTTSTDWSVSGVLDTTIVTGTALRHRSTSRDCSPVTGTVQVCNKTYGKNGWLGIAQIWIGGGHITQGTTKLNDTYFNTQTYNTPAWRNLVMCQEVGHTLGLDHQDEVFNNFNLGTCMDYTNAPDGGIVNGFNYGPSNQHPNPHDYVMLKSIYAHLDESTTISAAKSAGASALAQSDDFQNASEWGKAIRYSSDGKPSLHVRDLGKGEKIFTFVIWANE